MSDDGDRQFSSNDGDGSFQDSKSKPGAKPRASRAGTRSVTTLNAEQLARKRANDREAQRAIRQRTREHIERLENRIKELSENNPESDAALEAVQRRNAELEEELRQLRQTLYGMGEGSSSPGPSHQLPGGYVANPRGKLGSVQYAPQWAAQNVHAGGFAPTSNPMPEGEPSWQPPAPNDRRRQLQHHHAGVGQPISWARGDSSDSDYDSAYGLDQDQLGHPVGAYPPNNYLPSSHLEGHMQHGGARQVMWQTPPNSSGVNTPYEVNQLPNMPPNDPSMFLNTSYFHQPGTPRWGSPLPQQDREAYF